MKGNTPSEGVIVGLTVQGGLPILDGQRLIAYLIGEVAQPSVGSGVLRVQLSRERIGAPGDMHPTRAALNITPQDMTEVIRPVVCESTANEAERSVCSARSHRQLSECVLRSREPRELLMNHLEATNGLPSLTEGLMTRGELQLNADNIW